MDSATPCAADFAEPSDEYQITLQVGETQYITTKETLTHESGFFAALLSGRWDRKGPNGSYFIDADPELFQHILQYLRRGILPVFFNQKDGHNMSLYFSLLQEARFFQIPRLTKWLETRGYLKAVWFRYSTHLIDGFQDGTETLANEEVHYNMAWHVNKVYVCPRRIEVHRGKPESCGQQCNRARGNEDRYEEEIVVKTLVTRKEMVYDPTELVEYDEEDSSSTSPDH